MLHCPAMTTANSSLKPPTPVDFFFDLSSPYSYLAATQLDAIAARNNAEIAWKPIVLGAVFKSVGNSMPAACPPKAAYMFKDLGRWAAHYGVPFAFNSRFPVNAIRAMRLIVAAGLHCGSTAGHAGLSRAAFAAVWVDDQDMTTDNTLRALLVREGLPVDLLAAIETAPVKDRLRAYTDDAIARGVFGAPAIFVGGELFWGNDRLDFVEAALRQG